MDFQSSPLLPACTAHKTPRELNLGGQLCCRKRFPMSENVLRPCLRSGKKIFFLISSALRSFAVAVMSKAVSTDLTCAFSSLECTPQIRATSTGLTVSYQTAKGWQQPPPAANTGCSHTADFKVERIFITLTNSTNQLHLCTVWNFTSQ